MKAQMVKRVLHYRHGPSMKAWRTAQRCSCPAVRLTLPSRPRLLLWLPSEKAQAGCCNSCWL